MNLVIKNYFTRKQSALALVDVVMALIVILVVTATVGYFYNNASTTAKLTDIQSNLIVLRSQIAQVFSGSSSYDELSNELVLKAGVVPTVFVKGTNIINQWGGEIDINSTDDGSGFTISVSDIPDDICIKLGAFQPDSWLGVEINGSNIEDGSVTALAESCSNDKNTLIFTAR